MQKTDVLIFCPDITGHRQVYTSVLSRYMISTGRAVVVAANISASEDARSSGALLIHCLLKEYSLDQFRLHDIGYSSIRKAMSKCVENLDRLEQFFKPQLTLFPAGDEILQALDGRSLPSLKRNQRRVGVFIQYGWIYRDYIFCFKGSIRPTESPMCKLYYRVKEIRNRFRFVKKQKKQILASAFRLMSLDKVLCTNPDFIDRFGDERFLHMPDIYMDWDCTLSGNDSRIIQQLKALELFLDKNADKTPIIYYGGFSARRGYDTLLRLVMDDEQTVFISCGGPAGDYPSIEEEVFEQKKILSNQGRFLELEIPFLPDNSLIDKLFEASKFVILPYRYFYNISGMMIQSASYRKPVLVPSIGAMANVVKKYQIGMTYKHESYKDMKRCSKILSKTYRNYIPAVEKFAQIFSKTKVYESLNKIFFN